MEERTEAHCRAGGAVPMTGTGWSGARRTHGRALTRMTRRLGYSGG